MRVKTILCRCAIALGLVALALPALAENARLPYHLLYQAQKARTELSQAHTNLLIVLTMQSTLASVKTSDLALYIDAKAGRIPVGIGAAGEFAVPLRDDLLAEDPWIIVNQPRGTMKLSWQVGLIPGRIGRSIHYARLMRPLRESEEVQEQIRRFSPGSPRLAVIGLRLTFAATPTRAAAVIHAKGGDRRLEANEHGEIIIPLVQDLLDEDPEIMLTDTPAAVEIISREKEH